ncbi:MAG: MoxR family ATPase [Deltaproteobacteria bacterium]|jgi:MoxR-like ATPase|nr:MoxR family ATPase [Deltaproteobacteria bacterium]
MSETTKQQGAQQPTDAPLGSAELLQKIDGFKADVRRLRDEVGQVIVGHEEIVQGVVVALLSGGQVLLEGVPGLGKTMLVRTLAEAIDLTFSRVQFTPDLMPADILGTNMLVEDDRGGRRFEFQRGPIFAHIVLADEINRSTPKTQSALLEAMQEQTVTVAKHTYPLPQPFFVLATQNPLEMEGTYPLPEAQLDRFFFKLRVDFPSRAALHSILDRTTSQKNVRAKKVLGGPRLLELRELVRQVPVARSVQDFAIRVLQATHPGPEAEQARRGKDSGKEKDPVRRFVRYGASPRGAQALLLGAKVLALLDGRFSASAADVRAVAKPALRHRLILNFEGQAEGVSADDIIDSILARTPDVSADLDKAGAR